MSITGFVNNWPRIICLLSEKSLNSLEFCLKIRLTFWRHIYRMCWPLEPSSPPRGGHGFLETANHHISSHWNEPAQGGMVVVRWRESGQPETKPPHSIWMHYEPETKPPHSISMLYEPNNKTDILYCNWMHYEQITKPPWIYLNALRTKNKTVTLYLDALRTKTKPPHSLGSIWTHSEPENKTTTLYRMYLRTFRFQNQKQNHHTL